MLLTLLAPSGASGAVNKTLNNLTLSASGVYELKLLDGEILKTLEPLSGSITGQKTAVYFGDLSKTLATVTSSITGQKIPAYAANTNQVLASLIASVLTTKVQGTIEGALRKKMIAASFINSIVGERVYPLRMPDNAILPAIVYTRITSERQHTLGGSGNLTYSRFVIDSYSNQESKNGGFAESIAIARAVQATLDGYRGPADGVDIQGILQMTEQHLYDSELEIYRVSQDWMVIHRE